MKRLRRAVWELFWIAVIAFFASTLALYFGTVVYRGFRIGMNMVGVKVGYRGN